MLVAAYCADGAAQGTGILHRTEHIRCRARCRNADKHVGRRKSGAFELLDAVVFIVFGALY